jgi:hypothetical protein
MFLDNASSHARLKIEQCNFEIVARKYHAPLATFRPRHYQSF